MDKKITEHYIWFKEYLEPHSDLVINWIKARFEDIQDPEDILQEAYLRVITAHEQSHIQSPKAYLFATARNIALGRYRKAAKYNEIHLADFAYDSIIDTNSDVSREVAKSEELEMLTKAIQTLPKRCRQVITLRKIYGLSQKQVAQELGITENTVETQGAIGLKKLSKYFERHRA